MRLATTAAVFALALSAVGCKKKAPPPPAPSGPMAGLTPRLVALSGSCSRRPDRSSQPVALLRTGLHLGADPSALLPPPTSKADGFDASFKPRGRSDLLLAPLASALAAQGPDRPRSVSLFVEGQGSVSYRMLIETVFTLGQQGVRGLELVARSDDHAPCALPIDIPSVADTHTVYPEVSLNLAPAGLSLKAQWNRSPLAAQPGLSATLAMLEALKALEAPASSTPPSPSGRAPAARSSASAQAAASAALSAALAAVPPPPPDPSLNAGPGCTPGQPGYAFEGAPPSHDVDRTLACARKLYEQLMRQPPEGDREAAATPLVVVVSAGAEVEMDTVLRLIAALQAARPSPLAAKVRLAIAR